MSDVTLTHPTVTQTRIVNFVLSLTSIILTLFRIYERYRNRKFWWDDAWAALTLVLAIIFMIAVELHLEDPTKFPRNVKISLYYMCDQFFYLVSWNARVSILFTIVRLTAPGIDIMRRLLFTAAVLFGITWAVLSSQVWWVCESQEGWKDTPYPQCFLGSRVAIAQVITDVICDTILIVAPLHLVFRVKLSGAQRIRVIAIFSTTILTTAVSLNHAYWVLRDGGLKEYLAAIVQTTISLIVLNLSVVVAFFFRISTDDGDSRPVLGVRSIVTVTHLGARRAKVDPIATTDSELTTYDAQMQLDCLSRREIQLPKHSSEGDPMTDSRVKVDYNA
ncbi:hypothetical protein A0H81_13627 [Grifola frondosa]|uniref:Rhodopsin domain-containing protein n=1 Tax=Grifola frondosa TaxID=5627 RepID=A0A1C7LP79_GRIFR|nr:hypothetical protein A0H81_13627 [Grifola frondosa]